MASVANWNVRGRYYYYNAVWWEADNTFKPNLRGPRGMSLTAALGNS